ncbi:hypothetical protein [Streptomyces sp. 3214.6]|uniref:hypothetical protein n=1 Tax=Streptomyces sp. 3214.6 TaxID=1882757 RepID=UPI0009A5CB77|nr:hypothetical protein [Streptomyces sp. 3214.6]
MLYLARQTKAAGEQTRVAVEQAKVSNVVAAVSANDDVMSSGVHVHERVPESGSAGPWTDYCRQTVENSPVLRHLLRAHPTWWPHLLSVLPDHLLQADGPARVPAPGGGQGVA